MHWNPWYVLLLMGTTIISYMAGLSLCKKENRKIKLGGGIFVLSMSVLVLLCLLMYFKYYDMLLGYLNKLLSLLNRPSLTRQFEVLLPVGISFYILQSLGYVLDVYKGDTEPQRNIFKYALFISFFPQLVAGPIERSNNLMRQLGKPSALTWDNFRRGILLICYGVFCKIVIADRIAIIVKTVYGNPDDYPGFYILYAAILFSFQIYCDFYGYSTIARGSAQLLGITLVDNFNAPYFSKSIKEFWRRWHISLSSWFRDYLYIPLGGNRKGFLRKHFNLLFVFTISGLWHGASLSFVIWGGLNGFYQVVSEFFEKLKGRVYIFVEKFFSIKLLNRPLVFSKRVAKTIITFCLISLTWIFFAADSFRHAVLIIKRIFVFNWNVLLDESLYGLGVGKKYTFVMLLGILLLMIVDYQKYKGKDVVSIVLAQNWWFRALTVLALIVVCMVFGCYGGMYDTQQFIYFQF